MTQNVLDFPSGEQARQVVAPMRELGAYEALWMQPGASFKKIADLFRASPGALPSHFVPGLEAMRMARRVVGHLRERGVDRFGVRIHGVGEYPPKLRDAAHPLELFYFQGIWDLVEAPCVAVIGTRRPSAEGIQRTRQLVRRLVQDGWTIVSGLAEGIDTVAHWTAVEERGQTIAVIGTPLSEVYPRSNANLQARLGRDFLVISQIPVARYTSQNWRANRAFFPERNVTMSALTAATIIVEAGETSGTLTQARAALGQQRRLMILGSCFRNPRLSWPRRLEAKGALRIESFAQVQAAIGVPRS